MINFKINYYNIDEKLIQKKLFENKDKINEINKIFQDLPSLMITSQTKDLDDIKKVAEPLIKNKESIVILGTGGSNLGARALINILQNQERKKFFFIDNVDPIQFRSLINKLNISKVGFIIISKSGYTPETLSQFTSIIELLKSNKNMEKLLKECVVITENTNNPLKKIADKYGCHLLYHDINIGGRFSVFSNVGMLPAFIAGLDIIKIREGAKEIIDKTLNNLFKEHLFGGQIITHLYFKKIINLNVLITYSDALYYFGKWFLQLWAESIGKKMQGITPIHSIGTTDQHSQQQLYLEGPKDKFFSFITKDHRKLGLKMNEKILNEIDIKYLAGKTMGDLMYAEQQATLNTFINEKLPVREIHCNCINEYSIGQLMAYFMMETIFACYLIGVDPFNQPAVEHSKKLTIDYLSKKK